MRRLRACGWLCCVGLHAIPLAHADVPSPSALASETNAHDAREPARRHFTAASELARQGDWSAALEAYRQSFALFPSAVTLFNIGYCHAQLGRWVAALRVTTAALDEARFEAERRLTPERRRVAEAQLSTIQSHVGTISFSGAPATRVTVNGVRTTPLGSAGSGAYVVDLGPLPELTPNGIVPLNSPVPSVIVHPGRHRVTVSIGLDDERSYDILLAAGQDAVVRLPHAPLQPPVQPAVRAPAIVTIKPRPSHWTTPAGIGALAFAAVGFGVAAGFGLAANGAAEELDENCSSQLVCGPAQRGTVERYQRAVTWTNVGLLSGVIGAATGLTLLLVPAPKASEATAIGLSPSGVALRRTF